MSDELTKIALFEQKEIRKVLHGGEWWFVINDVVLALTDSRDVVQYIKKMRQRDTELNTLFTVGSVKGGVQFVPPLALPFKTAGGKQKLLTWNTEGIFRLIQSIPSKNAEPMKLWLAKTAYERIQEIENPELAQKRMKETYRAKGYDEAWIERRVRGIAIRNELTDEWSNRGADNPSGYAILTSEISKAAFGVTPHEYKKLKGIKRENLRDHMTDLELLFSQLGEAATTEITKAEDAKGIHKLKDSAQRGGSVAGTAREQLEAETKKKVISEDNFLNAPQRRLK